MPSNQMQEITRKRIKKNEGGVNARKDTGTDVQGGGRSIWKKTKP